MRNTRLMARCCGLGLLCLIFLGTVLGLALPSTAQEHSHDLEDHQALAHHEAGDLSLSINETGFRSGDRVIVRYTFTTAARVEGEVYAAVTSPTGRLKFFPTMTETPRALGTAFEQGSLARFRISLSDTGGLYQVYAVVVPIGADPFNAATWLSNLATVEYEVQGRATETESKTLLALRLDAAHQPTWQDEPILRVPIRGDDGLALLRLQAAYTPDMLFLRAAWTDATKDDQIPTTVWNPATGIWSLKPIAGESEDSLLLAFPIAGAGPDTNAPATTAPEVLLAGLGDILDVWLWKAATTNPQGLAADLWQQSSTAEWHYDNPAGYPLALSNIRPDFSPLIVWNGGSGGHAHSHATLVTKAQTEHADDHEPVAADEHADEHDSSPADEHDHDHGEMAADEHGAMAADDSGHDHGGATDGHDTDGHDSGDEGPANLLADVGGMIMPEGGKMIPAGVYYAGAQAALSGKSTYYFICVHCHSVPDGVAQGGCSFCPDLKESSRSHSVELYAQMVLGGGGKMPPLADLIDARHTQRSGLSELGEVITFLQSLTPIPTTVLTAGGEGYDVAANGSYAEGTWQVELRRPLHTEDAGMVDAMLMPQPGSRIELMVGVRDGLTGSWKLSRQSIPLVFSAQQGAGILGNNDHEDGSDEHTDDEDDHGETEPEPAAVSAGGHNHG